MAAPAAETNSLVKSTAPREAESVVLKKVLASIPGVRLVP
jgi:hypothetical protein